MSRIAAFCTLCEAESPDLTLVGKPCARQVRISGSDENLIEACSGEVIEIEHIVFTGPVISQMPVDPMDGEYGRMVFGFGRERVEAAKRKAAAMGALNPKVVYQILVNQDY